MTELQLKTKIGQLENEYNKAVDEWESLIEREIENQDENKYQYVD